MTVDVTGMAGAQARIAEIQSRFAAMSGGATQRPVSYSSPAGFEAALAKAAATRAASAGDSALTATDATDGLTSLPGTGTSARAESVLAAARKYLGVPYKWGGTDPRVGLDCSGFVQRAYADIGIKLPRVAADQARQGTKVPSLAAAKPGDLVAFGSPVDHIGIYVGDNKMIVAPRTGDVVKIQTVYRTPTAIRRILPETAASASGWQAAMSAVPGLASAGVGGLLPPSSGTASGAVSGSALAAAPPAYRALFEQAERRYGVKAELLAAVAKAESGFNASARSRAGAIGLMQIMPGTARGLGVDPRNPAQAVDGAARLLREGLSTFRSTELALAAYNAGTGAVRRYGGVPPYAETRSYVRKIMADPGVATA